MDVILAWNTQTAPTYSLGLGGSMSRRECVVSYPIVTATVSFNNFGI